MMVWGAAEVFTDGQRDWEGVDLDFAGGPCDLLGAGLMRVAVSNTCDVAFRVHATLRTDGTVCDKFPDVFQPGFPAFLREKASEMYPRRFSGVVATPPPATSPTIAKTVEMP